MKQPKSVPGGAMSKDAIRAVEKLWSLTVKSRALCPYASDSAIGSCGYLSPPWYRKRGAVYFVNLAQPLTADDVKELRQIGEFINRSLIISMAAVLEEHGVVPYRGTPDCSKKGGKHAKLAKRLRNHFAHGEWVYDANDSNHVETRNLLLELFPDGGGKGLGFVTSIDEILEPLKDGVLAYIRAVTSQ